ncbi:MAG: radical SAM protein [Candidatus Omnitrophota bacterium]
MKNVDLLMIQSPFGGQGILAHTDCFTVGEGILSICTFLDSKGYSTEIFPVDEVFIGVKNFKFDRKRYAFPETHVAERIRSFNPRVVAISALTPQYPSALKIARICKEVDPGIVTVMGGPHVTYNVNEVFSDSTDVDVVVRGEGEWTMLDIMEHVRENKPLDDVAGITFRKKGKIKHNPDRPLGNLEELPPVDYSKVNPDFLSNCRFFMTFTRGCRFNCSYCVESKFWGHCVRYRSVEAIMNEMRFINENQEGDIYFLARVFNHPEDFFYELCDRMRSLRFAEGREVAAMVGAANLPREHVEAMKEAGINTIVIAVESASPEILKRMRKGISFDLVVEKCRMIKEYDMTIGTFWIMGHPGETEETARVSLDAMAYLWEQGLSDRQEIALFTPYPGLPMLKNPEKEGFRFITDDYGMFSRFDRPVIELTTLPYDELLKLYQEARQMAQYWLTCNRDFFNDKFAAALKKTASS